MTKELVPLVCALLFAACAPLPSPAPAAARDARHVPAPGVARPAPFPTERERAALFAELVGVTRRYHAFSELTQQNLNLRWHDELPALADAFRRASDEAELRDALSRFVASLHDAHLSYAPPASAGRGERLTLGVTLETEWVEGRPRFYVAALTEDVARRAPGLRRGDLVVAAAGVAAADLPRAHASRSNANNWRGVAADVARHLTERSTAIHATRPGQPEAWRFAHRDGGDVAADLAWRRAPWPGEAENEADDDDGRVDYAPAACSADLPERAYPAGYRLTSHGRFYCLYVSDRAAYAAYPIVRHFSFRYSPVTDLSVSPAYLWPDTGWNVSADYFSLRAALRALPRVAGLVLDLRDNHGGNDPDWFLDWYAPAPYVDMVTSVRALPEYHDAAFRARVDNVDDGWYRWFRRATAGLEPGAELQRPFKCVNAACSGDNRFSPAHGLIAAPVALLVGPACGSSCAHVAHIFDENDFGPLIGEPTAASYTAQRLTYPVKTAAGLDLGAIRLGLSRDRSGKTGLPVEGYAVHLDRPVERSFDEPARWDSALVDAALSAFRTYPFPKRTAPLGP